MANPYEAPQQHQQEPKPPKSNLYSAEGNTVGQVPPVDAPVETHSVETHSVQPQAVSNTDTVEFPRVTADDSVTQPAKPSSQGGFVNPKAPMSRRTRRNQGKPGGPFNGGQTSEARGSKATRKGQVGQLLGAAVTGFTTGLNTGLTARPPKVKLAGKPNRPGKPNHFAAPEIPLTLDQAISQVASREAGRGKASTFTPIRHSRSNVKAAHLELERTANIENAPSAELYKVALKTVNETTQRRQQSLIDKLPSPIAKIAQGFVNKWASHQTTKEVWQASKKQFLKNAGWKGAVVGVGVVAAKLLGAGLGVGASLGAGAALLIGRNYARTRLDNAATRKTRAEAENARLVEGIQAVGEQNFTANHFRAAMQNLRAETDQSTRQNRLRMGVATLLGAVAVPASTLVIEGVGGAGRWVANRWQDAFGSESAGTKAAVNSSQSTGAKQVPNKFPAVIPERVIDPTQYHGHKYLWGYAEEKFGKANATPKLHELIEKARAQGWKVDTQGDPKGKNWIIAKVTGPDGTVYSAPNAKAAALFSFDEQASTPTGSVSGEAAGAVGEAAATTAGKVSNEAIAGNSIGNAAEATAKAAAGLEQASPGVSPTPPAAIAESSRMSTGEFARNTLIGGVALGLAGGAAIGLGLNRRNKKRRKDTPQDRRTRPVTPRTA